MQRPSPHGHDRDNYRVAAVAAGIALLNACGFVDYQPLPFEPAQLIDAVQTARVEAPGGEAATLDRAGVWLRDHGPRVREAVAAFDKMRARAEVAEPLPNPSIDIGPIFGVGSGTPGLNSVVPFAAVGWSIPLTDRRARADELARAEAEVARIDAIATLRDEWIALRAEFSELAVAHARASLRADLAAATQRTTEAARMLVEAGVATAAELATFDLEHAQTEALALDNEIDLERLFAALASRTGVDASSWRELAPPELPRTPEALPTTEELRRAITEHHPELLRLRAEFAAADRALRLTLALQYPDLRIGSVFDGQAGDSWGLLGFALGIDLPLFSRNQREIAGALGHRQELFTRYQTAANRALATIDGALRVLEISIARRQLVAERILPLAERQLELVERAVNAGTADIMRFLDATRSERAARLADLESRLELVRAWSALERATGMAFLEYDNGGAEPAPPEGMTK